jgi:S1-C subfamily serine protease
MGATKLVAVRCGGCGQVYWVSPPAEDQRAKCRPCGHEFVIPSSTAERAKLNEDARSGRYPSAEKIAAAQMTAQTMLRPPFRPWRLQDWNKRRVAVAVAFGLIPVLAALSYSTFSSPAADRAAAQKLRRGRVAKLSAPRSEFEFASVTELIEAVEPSVVQIETRSGIGSGFVLDASGLIVTCHHCIAEATEADVVFADGRRSPVLGVLVDSAAADVAVLVVQRRESLAPLALAPRPPKKGDPIVAIGSPVGLSFSISEGSVSGLRTPDDLKDLPGPIPISMDLSPNLQLVQYTASTMPGNSGGPVVDFSGNVVGISSFVFDWRGQLFEFCIAAEEIRKLIADLELQVTPLWVVRSEEMHETHE